MIRDIKVSDAQQWMIKLQEDGKGYSTLTSIRGVVKPAFQMAYNEEIVRRNPFNFKLTDVVVNDSQKRISMTEQQQETWMNFIRADKGYSKYYEGKSKNGCEVKTNEISRYKDLQRNV